MASVAPNLMFDGSSDAFAFLTGATNPKTLPDEDETESVTKVPDPEESGFDVPVL